MSEILIAISMFTGVVLALVAIILLARIFLVNTGDVTIEINDDPERSLVVPAGGKLLSTLASKGIFLSSACGGQGTDWECTRVEYGDGGVLFDFGRLQDVTLVT